MTNLLLWNPGSGKSEQHQRLRDALVETPVEWVELNRQLDVVKTIRDSLQRGCERVLVAGGDGTVNLIVNALMQIDVSERPQLAVLPMGTANDFAQTLAIPDDVTQASQLFRENTSIAVDVVRICGDEFERYYANVAAGGNCVRVSEELTDEIKKRWGALCYLRGAVDVLADMQSFCITAEVDGECLEGLDTWAILVANGRTNAGHIEVAPLASPVDGLLDLIIIKDGDVMDMVDIVSKNLLGNFLACEQVIFRQTRRFRLQSDPPMRFTLDGELVDQEPIEFEAIPGAIRMFVGPDFMRSE